MTTLKMLAMAMAVAGLALAAAGDEVALVDGAKPRGGWTFDNGREFPGATGELALEAQGGRSGGAAIVLKGNFTQGGNYVQASCVLGTPVPLGSLSLWVKAPDQTALGVRLVDSAGTCHQLKLKLRSTPDWQPVRFPAADYLATMAESRAADMVIKYEHWGKEKDQTWHGALASMHVLLTKASGTTPVLWLSDVAVVSGEAPPAGQPKALVTQTVALDEVLQAGEVDWSFDNGREFKGASGSLTLVKDQPAAGQNALRLAGDFTGGGAYVQATRKLPELAAGTLESLSLMMRSTNCPKFNVRLIDSTGQCHQHKGVPLQADGQWHEVVLTPSQVAGGEHWGGANDGKWHGSATLVAVLMNKGLGDRPVIEFGQARAVLAVAQAAAPAAYREGFESADLPQGWQSAGSVAVTASQPFAGKGALQVTRTVDTINQAAQATGPAFAAQAGTWEVAGAGRSALYSPDSSYQGVVSVEWSDGAGKALGRAVALELRGTNVWQPFRRTFEAPAGTASGRVRIELEKTYGSMAVDDLSVAFVPPVAGAARRIDRVMLAPACLGGMFLPEQAPAYKLSVWAPKPLQPEELEARVSVSDYWGAEQGARQTVKLQKAGFKQQVFQYESDLVLATNGLDIGRFYRVHVDVPQRGGKPFRFTIGMARLPEAATKQYPPDAIPFTIRNWDNRMKDYFFLTDRIGIRMPGIWGGWDNKPPYKAHGPGVEWCRQLGMKWVSGLPGAQVERGNFAWSDPAMLQAGMTNFLKAYATNGLAYLCLGNEPHGGPSQVASNIAAYKAMYEAAKGFDTNIHVIATSVEPNEEYFRQGYQKYCDIYDFHTYESYPGIRKTIEAYKELMRKYNAEKPIYSTELGLNCQGLSRLIVAQEMVKKFAVFFAAGGANASWFTIMYPDPKGTEANSSGQAFNVYDARYNQFNPKLDAVTLYHAVNAIADKRFRAERHYGDGTESYLFANADGDSLQIAWNEKARADIGLPVPGATSATLILMDGTTVALVPDRGAVTVSVSSEPIMVLYRSKAPALGETLAPPALALAAVPQAVVKGQDREIPLHGAGLTAAAVAIAAPPGWNVNCRDAGADAVNCRVTPPVDSEAQAGRLAVRRVAGGVASAAIVVDLPVESSFAGKVAPAVDAASGAPALLITLVNHSQEAAALHWQASLEHEIPMAGGTYRLTDPQPAKAGFGEANDGTVTLAAGASRTLRLPLRDVAPLTLYRVALRVGDDSGHESVTARYVAGFMGVHRGTPAVDGDLGDAAWAKAPVGLIGDECQVFAFKNTPPWGGTNDLSGTVRYLWDDQYLYLGVHVVDNAFVGNGSDGELWKQDGLQFLADPRRQGGEKMGYYDCSLGLGTKGGQMWCHSTASPDVMTGEVKDARVAVKRGPGGNADYEVAIPWSRLAPFKPVVGGDLGMGLIVNDEDGSGRRFLGWFSGVHLKETDMVGDLILCE